MIYCNPIADYSLINAFFRKQKPNNTSTLVDQVDKAAIPDDLVSLKETRKHMLM